MSAAGSPVARLRRMAASWPRGTARVARDYLEDLQGRGPRAGDTDPYWVLLPTWLYRSAPPSTRRGLRRGFLGDVCWGQYCLFLCVRIHDDLFDAQATDSRLLWVGDHLLLESQRAFAPHVPDAFWPIYREALQTTVSAILEMDECARAGVRARDGLLAHARVSSIFTVGSAAVCLATGRHRAYGRIAAFAGELAILSQVLDDLRDLPEDLDRGRLNSVGALLLDAAGRASSTGPGPALLGVAGASLLYGDGSRRLVTALRRSHARARRAIQPVRIPEADTYVQSLGENIDRLAGMLHRARVEARFGALVPDQQYHAESATGRA